MRFGFILPNLISPISNAEGIKTSAQLAEDVGFDSMWATDHVLMPVAYPQYALGTEAVSTLAYLAGMTRRIELGTSILVLPMRNPLIVAKEIASIAHLSGRALTVAVGVGWSKDEYGFLNADFHHRGKLMDEYITILRALWTQEQPEHHGTYNFSGVTFSPRLENPPDIWVGGESDAAIQRAATLGDGYHPGWRDHTDYGAIVKRLRAASNGRKVTTSLRRTFDLHATSAAQVADALAALDAVGLEYPVVGFKHDTLAELTRSIEIFGRDVMPLLRAT
ncbi:MAG: TIGR03619 family F420-dependent LLM class oxidoreductase [Anaerolineae bacterium]|nr:TIGR03619 family F420-dependent LLM class oxidoreductase [Anaerolineae bacterium]